MSLLENPPIRLASRLAGELLFLSTVTSPRARPVAVAAGRLIASTSFTHGKRSTLE